MERSSLGAPNGFIHADLQGGEEGVIVACGGMTGGYTMYLMDGRLVFDYNYLDGVHYKLTSPPLPTGPTELKFNFIKTGENAGVGELYVNGVHGYARLIVPRSLRTSRNRLMARHI